MSGIVQEKNYNFLVSGDSISRGVIYDEGKGKYSILEKNYVALVQERLKGIDLEQVPLPIATNLAIEIVSKNDRADDLKLKVSQYLQAGVQAVWLLYPTTKLAYRYVPGKLDPEVRSAKSGDRFEEPEMLSGFSLPLSEILKT